MKTLIRFLTAICLSSFTHSSIARTDDSAVPNANQEQINVPKLIEEIPLNMVRAGIQPEEAETYYRLLAYVSELPLQAVKNQAETFLRSRWKASKYAHLPFSQFPIFVDLYSNPESYQGQPITMTGRLQRTVKSEAYQNEYGIDEICESWLFTEDSQNNATVVITTKFPKDFPVGEQTVDDVTITGYFYRNYTYQARDAKRFAPLIVAHSIQWNGSVQQGEDDSFVWLILLGAVVVGVGAILGIVINLRIQRTPVVQVPEDTPRAIEEGFANE